MTPARTSSFDPALGAWSAWHDESMPLRIGVSSCLLGEEVRFDGGHKRSGFVVDQLGRWFEFVAVCPEVEIGMGIPRPTIRVEEEDGKLRLVAPKTGEDFTVRMEKYSRRRVRELMKEGLDGYILKKGSPSCGPFRLPVYVNGQPARRDGVGFFAAELRERWPQLPIEDEGRLNDNAIRESFIEQVFVRNRWRALVARGFTRRRLVAFHTAHKLLLRAHNEAGYRRLGHLVGSAGQTTDRQLLRDYEAELHRTMATRTTRARHTNVLQHAMGYLKKALDGGEKRELLSSIDDYRRGLLPLVVPMTLMRYNIRRHDVEYLRGQVYFDPHPKELMLLNHA
jgi:uncharacterized protein YbgA (DUF1722 family)/uncharacterized protein YbbK (DUF523 family)